MSYEPRKKLAPVFINNTTQYSSLTTVVDYTGDGVLNYVGTWGSTSGNRQIKITIDGSIVYDSGALSSTTSVMSGTNSGGVDINGLTASNSNTMSFSTGLSNIIPINIPFSTSLKIEITNNATTCYNKILYSKYI